MGKGMATNLLKAGYKLNIHTRTKEKANELFKLGAVWRNSIKELVQESNVIITMVGSPKDVEDIYFSEAGILENAKRDTFLIDMTTSKPSLAKRLYQSALTKNLLSLDAPVSGGEKGAKQGKLTIMVGGDKSTYHQCLSIFNSMGKNIVYKGLAGSGQYTKMCNQMAMAANMLGVCEAIIFAKKAGMDPRKVIKTISNGTSSSWVIENLALQMIDGDYRPGFYVKHLVKDLEIALESAQEMNIFTPNLELSLSLFRELADMGEGNNGTRILMKLYEMKSGLV